MDSETEKVVDEFRKRIETITGTFSLDDFKRVHAKFFGGIIALEALAMKQYPEEWEKHMEIFYEEQTNV